jgi:hypothetical protein
MIEGGFVFPVDSHSTLGVRNYLVRRTDRVRPVSSVETIEEQTGLPPTSSFAASHVQLAHLRFGSSSRGPLAR